MIPEVSVIVPVYNSECYLKETVDSIISQSVRNIEIILVDDGSSDNSLSLCRSLASEDQRIRVVSISHSGPGEARNAGIRTAAGKWISFIDSDDLIHPLFLETILDLSQQTGSDIVISPHLCVPEDENFLLKHLPDQLDYTLYSPKEAIKLSLYRRKLDSSLCGKIFRSSLLDKNTLTKGILYEDLDSYYRIFDKAGRIAVIDEPMYLYRTRGGSIINTFNRGRLDVIEVTDRIESYMREKHPDLIPAARSRRLSANFDMLRLLTFNPGTAPEYKRKCIENIRSLRMKCIMDPNVRVKFKAAALLSYLGYPLLKTIFKIFGKL